MKRSYTYRASRYNAPKQDSEFVELMAYAAVAAIVWFSVWCLFVEPLMMP